MNVRILYESTPARRLAGVFRDILNKYAVPYPNVPDYADLADYIHMYVEYELLSAELNCDRSPAADMKRKEKLERIRAEIFRRHI